MVTVRGNTDLSRQAEEISDLASFIIDRLKLMEGDHPYLKSVYPEYQGLKHRIEQALMNPPENKGALGALFDKLRECLHRISDERSAQITTPNDYKQRLIPRNYLPMSFDLLLENFAESELHHASINAVADITEDVIFGDMSIEEITYGQRDRIKARILKALVCDFGRAAEIRSDLSEYGEEVFELLKLSKDGLEDLRTAQGLDPLPKRNPEIQEPLGAAVALIILRTRAQISHKSKMQYSA